MAAADSAASGEHPRRLRGGHGAGDRLFAVVVRSAGATVFVVMGLIGLFLFMRGSQALREAGTAFFTESQWVPDAHRFGIAAVLLGTVLIGMVALAVAFPISLGAALYISEYAAQRWRRPLISLVDLMAAVPSIIYGVWGFFLLQPNVLGLSRWLSDWLGFIPFFTVRSAHDEPSTYAGTTFIAGLVVAVMVVPICTSVMREVFSQAPSYEREAAYALGATRWGMIRAVVLPFGRGGIIGGTMLALGRALGETVAVFLVLSFLLNVRIRILDDGGSSISSLIALKYGESSPLQLSGLMAAGLVLFLLTLAVNMLASYVVARSRSGAATEI
ncbi:phosphate ABC transporter permease subunit PstC [Actinoallomurus vinaceus]|uniref:Phosphate transport system permease protein n=1 Tax=Actinoallomurus vinaceus TaxID=1080074 RepID=A0ABP8U608_9ACTN